ncbi:ferritin-like domain-containing protein [Amycolatopsis sp. NPDC059021]|uniref:ferritin-like domain-containing protein n=1 Tax=Amycolatopsis sp. NPDC059021 TaxID=3346704 RepID=UPI00366D5933
MSVFDLPRLHFAGVATTRVPTGPRGGLLDLATNSALTEEGPYPADRAIAEYHDYLDRKGAKGTNFGGNGHFFIDARITCAELEAGVADREDPVAGRAVDMWGHYNPYLATTFNRARVFDLDPSSAWTTTLMVGQFCFGRQGRSHDVGYLCTGEVSGFCPPRWHRHGRSTVYQFVVRQADGLSWLDDAAKSPATTALRSTVESAGFDGLVVQFGLSDPVVPAPDSPTRWALTGTIAPWRGWEPRTYPAGRLLVPRRPGRSPLTVAVAEDHATANLVGMPEARALLLRTADDRLVARLPAPGKSGCLVTAEVVAQPGAAALCLSEEDGEMLCTEREINLQVDDACLFLEHPKHDADSGQDIEVPVRSFVRGRPGAVDTVQVRQFFNPRALPRDPVACAPDAASSAVEILRLRAGRLDEPGHWSSSCAVRTDSQGLGWFTVRGARAGSARIGLSARDDDVPADPDRPGSAAACYDNDDVLGYWAGAGGLSVRVLPDDWRLDDLSEDEVDYDLVYREIFAPYELLSSFMADEVFSLADRCRVRTYADLIWQMSDPANKAKTYYMPPTRDLTEPKARLLLKFLRAGQKAGEVPLIVPAAERSGPKITTRRALLTALRHGASIELAVMLQYLYAAFSIPAYGAGTEYVRRGEWTPEQLRLACGRGGEDRDDGIRGALLTVAREEMIHFLLVNNIIMATGETFYVPSIDFGTINNELPVPLDFSLEPFGIGSVQRFIAIEQPAGLAGEIRRGDIRGDDARGPRHPYASLSELYASIREGLSRVPGLFLVDKGRGGGEHHLFLRESINEVYPDYQLEVDDLSSALFAIDVITEQGEGGVLRGTETGEPAHFDTFLKMSELLMTEQVTNSRGRRAPWSPAYPVVRNPSLHDDDPAKEQITDPRAREVLVLFNRAYFMMLQLMVQHFGQRPDSSLRRSEVMNMAIEVMTGVLRPLGELLVTLPSGRRGRTAGPSFELEEPPGYTARPDVAMRAITLRFRHLASAARTCELVPESAVETLEFLTEQFRTSPRFVV